MRDRKLQMLVLVAMALAVAVRTRASQASAATTPEQLGREFCAQQEGVDEADSFLLEWEVFFDEDDSQPDAVYSVAWQEGRIFSRHESPPFGRTNTAVLASDRTITLATSRDRPAEAAVFGYPRRAAVRVHMAWVLFPALRHWWRDFMEEAALRQELREHPDRLRRTAETQAGRSLSGEEVRALLCLLCCPRPVAPTSPLDAPGGPHLPERQRDGTH